MIEFRHVHTSIRGEVETEVTLVTHHDSLHEIMQDFRLFLLAMSFHSDTVDKYIEAD